MPTETDGGRGAALAAGVPEDALADVAYLTRSANRVRILDALAGESDSRRALTERTGTSRTTLDQIVNEFEERGWAERTDDGEYAATPTGEHLIAETRPYLASAAALRRLGEAVTWLPEDLSIGLHHFVDATVRRPPGDDPAETGDYFAELTRRVSELHVLTHLVPPVTLSHTLHDAFLDGGVTGQFVVTDDALEYLQSEPERRDRWRAMLDAGAEIFRVEGPIPCNLFVFGDTTLVKKSRPGSFRESYGVPIESENEAVREWALGLVEEHRGDATRVDGQAFAEDRGTD